jgi:type II secretory pathway pseudopilin PulG
MTRKEFGMRGRRPRRPTPAFVLACIALFAAMGGTGYAAQHTSKPLSKSQINKLIASYFKSHKSKLVGPRGATGPAGANGANGTNGTNGDRGPQGPGAIPLSLSTTSTTPSAQQVGNAGPWSFTLTCPPGGPAAFTVHGPGNIGGTTVIGGSPATPYVGGMGPIGGGATTTVGTGGNALLDNQLQSGSSLYELKMLISAGNGGLFETCNVTGEAIPVS